MFKRILKLVFRVYVFVFALGAARALLSYLLPVLTPFPPYAAWLFAIALFAFFSYNLYLFFYFRSDRFCQIKERISKYTADCNALNQHIRSLKSTSALNSRPDTGHALYSDNSKWNMRRRFLSAAPVNAPNVYNCSRTVCANARLHPFDYICKYFSISATEENLAFFETMLNNFEAAEDGKSSLQSERNTILSGVRDEVPFLIRNLSRKKLEQKLGFDPADLSPISYPQYIFHYTSSGGNAGTKCEIRMDIENLNRFVVYLSEKIKFRASAAGQRALMTSKLRNRIKERDGFACRICGASLSAEPHLLLEIDHIIPVSKGGLTTEENLQTLCWRCNRSKGAKM